MKKEPTIEIRENPEQRLIRLLQEKGAEDPETRELLNNWTQEQEQKVEKSNDPDAPILLNLTRAHLYAAAGYIEEALENFEDARTQAWNEQRDKLYQAIMREMDQLEESLNNQE